MKNIINKNTKDEYHGYQEWYYKYGLGCRKNTKNGFTIGYSERHKKIFGNIETNFNIR
jgi:hypothetical protein